MHISNVYMPFNTPVMYGGSSPMWRSYGLSLPSTGRLLYLGRPNLPSEETPIGEDLEVGEELALWAFLLPDSDNIRTATGWTSGNANLFYDADGTPTYALAIDIADMVGINTANVLFKLVGGADDNNGKLAIYEIGTDSAILTKAKTVLGVS